MKIECKICHGAHPTLLCRNTIKLVLRNFEHVQVGDTVTRMLAGQYPMILKVTQITDDLIVCGEHGWTFDRKTGAEVDDEIGWGPRHGVTGSHLVSSSSSGRASESADLLARSTSTSS
jgi:hypothetical protein